MAANSPMSKSSAPPLSQPATHALSGSQRVVQSLSALKHRNYRLYWFGQLASVLAQNMEAVAQSWLVLELTNSPLMLGLTGLTFTIPTVALTLLGGAVADRADRRRIMILAQVGSALVFLILTALVMLKWVALWHVMALAFLYRLRARLRPAEPDGAVTANGSQRRHSQRRRHRRHYLAVEQAGRPGGRRHADLPGRHRTDLFVLFPRFSRGHRPVARASILPASRRHQTLRRPAAKI